MGHGYKRSKRVGEQILKEVSDMLSKSEIKDPRLESVVLTNFYISDDMGFLKLYFTRISKDEEIEKIKEGLKSANSFIRKKISERLSLKKTPKIVFEFDSVLEKGYKIDELLKELKSE